MTQSRAAVDDAVERSWRGKMSAHNPGRDSESACFEKTLIVLLELSRRATTKECTLTVTTNSPMCVSTTVLC